MHCISLTLRLGCTVAASCKWIRGKNSGWGWSIVVHIINGSAFANGIGLQMALKCSEMVKMKATKKYVGNPNI